MFNATHDINLPITAWRPSEELIQSANITYLMDQLGFNDYEALHQWSVKNYPKFWQKMLEAIHIQFDKPYGSIVDLKNGIESPKWFPGSSLNIIKSCFQANPSSVAIISQNENNEDQSITYEELDQLSSNIAENLSRYVAPLERAAIIMPMTIKSIAIYLGIIKAGCCVVAIAESFSTNEIATRLRIAGAKIVFTQDYYFREGKKLFVYDKVITIPDAPLTIVSTTENKMSSTLREKDLHWEDFFLSNKNPCLFQTVSCSPDAYTAILFSSGTTGEPKAIPWDHVTPIKCGSDGYLYQNIQPHDLICWPTNLGWMMGAWLIYAALINKATIALYEGTPNNRGFGQFIQNKKINILGVVPTLVKNWRLTACMEGLNWEALKLFSSTGECSNSDDMLYLMSLTNNRCPIIEYCGGTEIGGAYITSTVIGPNAPAALNAKALGMDFLILDEEGKETDFGEVALVPPSIGLSIKLLNKDHHQIYYAGMPRSSNGKILRRHGDQLQRYTNGYYRMYGRIDDTMNLSGIKVSSIEIETVLNRLPDVIETAAIPIDPPHGGPSLLVIYVVIKKEKHLEIDMDKLKTNMQLAIKQYLNPLFKIDDIKIIRALPRTGSNKLLRRQLRDAYVKSRKVC